MTCPMSCSMSWTTRRTVLRTAALPLRFAALGTRPALAGLVALACSMARTTVAAILPLLWTIGPLAALVTAATGVATLANMRAVMMATALTPDFDRLGLGRNCFRRLRRSSLG